MKWTNKRPTVPGWYWFRCYNSPRHVVLEVYRSTDELFKDELSVRYGMAINEDETNFIENLLGQWSSHPIKPPLGNAPPYIED